MNTFVNVCAIVAVIAVLASPRLPCWFAVLVIAAAVARFTWRIAAHWFRGWI